MALPQWRFPRDFRDPARDAAKADEAEVFSARSKPITVGSSCHRPALEFRSATAIRRATANSAVDSVGASGVLTTQTPAALAAGTSMLS